MKEDPYNYRNTGDNFSAVFRHTQLEIIALKIALILLWVGLIQALYRHYGRPYNCPEIPAVQGLCAILYDSHDCSGGWNKKLPNRTQIRLSYDYKNDVDTVAVKAGCNFTGYTGNNYGPEGINLIATNVDSWTVLSENYETRHFDENIESVICICL